MRCAVLLFSAVVVVACGEPPTDPDAGHDAAIGDAGPPPFMPSPVSEPAAPELTPCPAGWREVTTSGGPVECDPWPETGREACGVDETHLPGEPGCRRIGGPCPADGVPTDLPFGALHVRPGATSGDGTRTAPFGAISEALAVTSGTVVLALAAGSYAETISVRDRSVTLIGACTETVFEAGGATPFITNRATLVLRNLKVRGTPGAILSLETDIVLEGVVLEDSSDVVVAATNGGSLDIRDALLLRASNGGVFFSGVDARLERVAIEDTDGVALSVRNGVLVARSLVVDGVRGAPAGFASVVSGADLTLEASVLISDPLTSIIAIDAGVTMEDVVMLAPRGAGTSVDQLLLLGSAGATIDLSRVRVERAGGLAFGFTDPETSVTMRDVLIREMLASGHAIEVGDGASAELGRVLVERSGNTGMLFFGAGTNIVARDVRVNDSSSDTLGFWGRGLGIQTGATLVGERVALSGNHEISLVVASAGTSATLTDLSITSTLERGCAASGCAPAGIGVGAYMAGALQVERFRIGDNALIGVQVALDGEIDLTDGVVIDNPIGANVQVPGYDLARLSDRVDYRDNGTNLDASELDVPEPTLP